MEGLISISDNDISSKLCEILQNLLVPDSTVIEKATSDLRQLNKHPSFVPSLFSVLVQSNEPETRKLAAIIFRRKVSRQWKSFSRDICIGVRKAVLERLLVEPEIKVTQSLSQVAASIAKYELATDHSWPDLFQLIKEGTENEKSRETTIFLLSVVCESASEPLEPHYIDLLQLLNNILARCDRKEHENTAVYAVKAFDSLVSYLGDEYSQLVRPLVLKCVAVTQMLLESDESRAADVMEVFESLIETEVSFISPYVKDLVLFSLEIASRNDLEDTTRIRALSLLRWIIKLKKKAIIKLNLVGPILDAVFPIITSQCDEDDEMCFASDDVESQYPITSSLYIIDELALHLPPEKLFHSIMPKIEMLAASNEPHHSRGLVLTIACLAEGTSEYIKNNHLKPFLELICRFSMHENLNVRNASLFAIGQFSEHLQPDISKYSSDLMPLLFDILQKTPETSKGITRAYYALENFVENLGDDILPYLDQLITHLLTMLTTSSLIHTKELVVSAIGAVANAAKEKLLPYLGQILSQLQECLPKPSQQNGTEENQDSENMNLLFMQTLDTLGVLARTIGKENFLPLAEDCLKLGKNLIENGENDPDMRRSAFGLFSAIATIVEEKLSPFLSFIVKHMLDSLRSSEGVTAHYSDETNGETSSKNFSFLDDDAETDLTTEEDIQDEDDDDIEGFSVENSFMEEKSDACEALGEIAKHTKAEFIPYLQIVFDEIYRLVDFPHIDVRKAAIASCGELTMCSYKLKHETFTVFLSKIFPIICKTIVSDTERLVVMGSIATANQMVECSGMNCFVNGERSLKELMDCILLVMNEKSSCQDQEEAEADDEQAEYDEMLIEYCGEILPVLTASLGCSVFLPYFNLVLPSLLAKTKSTCTSTERSFAAGTIAEICQKLGPGSMREFVGHLLPKFEKLVTDSEVDVRNNSIFGIGIILQNADTAGTQFYPSVLNTLFTVLKSEKNHRVIDNILGAVARMITTDKHAVPLKQALPVMLEHLPITEDHEEDGIVYSCLSRILLEEENFNEALLIHMLTILIRVLGIAEVEQEIKFLITNQVKLLHERKPSFVSNVCKKIDSPECQELKIALKII